MAVKELCGLGGFNDATFYKWRVKFGGMQAGEAARWSLEWSSKLAISERQSLQSSHHVKDTWSTDFVMDALADGRRIKCLTVVDDFSRRCVEKGTGHPKRTRCESESVLPR